MREIAETKQREKDKKVSRKSCKDDVYKKKVQSHLDDQYFTNLRIFEYIKHEKLQSNC